MSRSVKKNSILKDNTHGRKSSKRNAAHRIRNLSNEEAEVLMGKNGRFKYINQDMYEIYDYRNRWTEEEARAYWREIAYDEFPRFPHYKKEFLEKYPTEDFFIQKCWAKQIRK